MSVLGSSGALVESLGPFERSPTSAGKEYSLATGIDGQKKNVVLLGESGDGSAGAQLSGKVCLRVIGFGHVGNGEEIEEYLRQSRRILGALGRHLQPRPEQSSIRVPPPLGGFYLFPDFGGLAEKLAGRGIETSDELCRQLLADTGVARRLAKRRLSR